MEKQINNILFSFYQRYRNFILYCCIGCSGAGLDFVLYSILVAFTEIDYQVANVISCSCGIINNFFLNYFFNFKTRNRFFLRLLSFYCVGLVGMGISSLMLYLLIERFGINKILAKILTIFVVTIIQYALNKFISFRKARKC